MTADIYRFNFTWPVIEGKAEKQISVQIGESSVPDFVPLEEMLDMDTCVILAGPDEPEPCKMSLSIAPFYSPQAITLVLECPVIECYYGRLHEYHNTCHGDLVYTQEDVKVFRFDVRIAKDITEVQFKFISNKCDPLCLYGTRLYLVRNPNPLRTMMGGGRFNPADVQHRLQDADLSERAEKCKRLILGSMQSSEQNMVNNNTQSESPAGPLRTETDASNLEKIMESRFPTGPNVSNPFTSLDIKNYIDEKFIKLERMLMDNLAKLEIRQNEKLDRILALLQPGNKEPPIVD